MKTLIACFLLQFAMTAFPGTSPGRSPLFEEHAVDLDYPGMSCVQACDMDGDGDLDLVGGSEYTPYTTYQGIAWWRNDGGEPISWSRFAVAPAYENVMSVDVADIDGDELPDIVATSWNHHEITYFRNTGYPELLWVEFAVCSAFTNAHDAECADFDQDGDMDVVGINSTPGSVIVCYNDGAEYPNWSCQTLTTNFAGGKAVSVHDLDRDGDPDIVGCAMDAHTLAWWENQGGSPVS